MPSCLFEKGRRKNSKDRKCAGQPKPEAWTFRCKGIPHRKRGLSGGRPHIGPDCRVLEVSARVGHPRIEVVKWQTLATYVSFLRGKKKKGPLFPEKRRWATVGRAVPKTPGSLKFRDAPLNTCQVFHGVFSRLVSRGKKKKKRKLLDVGVARHEGKKGPGVKKAYARPIGGGGSPP